MADNIHSKHTLASFSAWARASALDARKAAENARMAGAADREQGMIGREKVLRLVLSISEEDGMDITTLFERWARLVDGVKRIANDEFGAIMDLDMISALPLPSGKSHSPLRANVSEVLRILWRAGVSAYIPPSWQSIAKASPYHDLGYLDTFTEVSNQINSLVCFNLDKGDARLASAAARKNTGGIPLSQRFARKCFAGWIDDQIALRARGIVDAGSDEERSREEGASFLLSFFRDLLSAESLSYLDIRKAASGLVHGVEVLESTLDDGSTLESEFLSDACESITVSNGNISIRMEDAFDVFGTLFQPVMDASLAPAIMMLLASSAVGDENAARRSGWNEQLMAIEDRLCIIDQGCSVDARLLPDPSEDDSWYIRIKEGLNGLVPTGPSA